MRLLIVGTLRGELITAAKIARERGASVFQVDGVEAALSHLRQGKGADLLMVDVNIDIRTLADGLVAERMNTPIIACGVANDKRAAVGVGKEVMARFLHEKSKRASKPFVSVNCAAIPDNLLESELFGHEKGAFTGAIARRIGKFEEADGGTLLLDEISEMDVRLQAKLLRAIQERVIDRVGGGRPVPVDIRIIATSNRNLAEHVKAGHFREDLLYRLNVVTLRIPALRERPADIIELAGHFGKKYAEMNGLPNRAISHDAKRVLLANAWRGNVRELENTMHRAVLLSMGAEISPDAIITPEGESLAQSATDSAARKVAEAAEAATRALVGRTVADVERELILDTLDHCLGNRTHAAKILGISIRTLRNKLNEYSADGLDIPEPGTARIAMA